MDMGQVSSLVMQGSLFVTSFVLNLLVTVGQGDGITGNLEFYHSVSKADELCLGVYGPAPSIAGWIGLNDDTDANPKRSFFWFVHVTPFDHEGVNVDQFLGRYFHAEEDPETAPIM